MKLRCLLVVVLVVAGSGPSDSLPTTRGKEMSEQNVDALLLVARDTQQELPARIRALEELSRMQRKDLAPRLHELWNRPRPAAGPVQDDWDPEGAERVVDAYIILALCKSDDSSLVPQISVLVAQAGNVLQGPDSELRNAAKVVRAIGDRRPIDQLVALAGGDNRPQAVANAVRTLQLLELPSPPSGGTVSAFADLSAPVTFTIHRLKEELEIIARLSNGRIVLSDATKEWVSRHDYDRGEVRRQSTSLAQVVTKEIDMLDLTYAVTQRDVVICTFREAGARWLQQWPDYSKRLLYDPASRGWRSLYTRS